MEDREDGAVRPGIEELVAVPARRERSRLGLSVADDARRDEVRVVEDRPEGVAQAVAELASSWIDPGVSGATWLGIPPGNEKRGTGASSRLRPS
jgi:hypothetical protein